MTFIRLGNTHAHTLLFCFPKATITLVINSLIIAWVCVSSIDMEMIEYASSNRKHYLLSNEFVTVLIRGITFKSLAVHVVNHLLQQIRKLLMVWIKINTMKTR